MHITNLSLNLRDLTVKVMDDGTLVFFFNCDCWPTISMSREEALELSCRLEQAAQKIEESEDSRKGDE